MILDVICVCRSLWSPEEDIKLTTTGIADGELPTVLVLGLEPRPSVRIVHALTC